MNRRDWIKAAAATAAAGSLPRWAWSRARFSGYPFALGVASGSPSHNSVVLWTRLAPNRLPLLVDQPITVRWELASDVQFKDIVRKGEAQALPILAHAIHVEVEGLQANHWYWYRFIVNDAVSAVGHTRTFPEPQSKPEQLVFAFASCQRWEHGYYAAYRHMRAEELDVVVFLGDYIYEYASAHKGVRSHSLPLIQSLADYRARYALYKSDEHLQRMHEACPWIVTWDDHEVQNDYANLQGQDLAKDFPQRCAFAYQAFYEHMPLRFSALIPGTSKFDALRLHERYRFGQLAQFHVLDDRQYRTVQACPPEGSGGSTTVMPANCAELSDVRRTLLGAAQERWLDEGLANDATEGVRWSVIAQQTLFSQRDFLVGPGEKFSTDAWDGYPAARARLIESIQRRAPRNTVFVGGDIHQNYVCNVKADFNKANSATIASEFCGTSISSNSGTSAKRIAEMVRENPHVVFANAEKRGYAVVRVTPKQWVTSLRVTQDVADPNSAIETLAEFVVEDGKPKVLTR